MSSGVPSQTAQAQKSAEMSTSSSPADLAIESTVNTALGVSLSSQQKLLVGSVLDLFAGKPTLRKLKLWTDTATFADPLTKAEGRKQYEAQWYGLKAAFSEIQQLSQSVTSAGNPITMDLKTRYKVKGIGSEQVIESVVKIYTDEQGERITKVEDRWNGSIPEGAFAKVSLSQLCSPWWWGSRLGMLGFWGWSLVWWSRPWEAFRNLNSVVVPAFVSVPKSIEEEEGKGK
ncbi:hypothetical protein V8E51_002838 [Hyaloscypha variabilis]